MNIIFVPSIIHFLVFILAFCSIVYELLLAQALSAFLENTVLRYCVTIALYMFSMGLGALAAEDKYTKKPVISLLKVEVLLTLFGGFSLVILHMLNFLGLPRMIFSFLAHFLIVCIGILTGFEVPLFFEITHSKKISSDNLVLGVNYLGAFAGTGCFAFLFYPIAGLMTTSFFIGTLNALCGLSLLSLKGMVSIADEKFFGRLMFLHVVILGIIGTSLFYSQEINECFMNIYMN